MIRIPLLLVLLLSACSIFAREAVISFSEPKTYCDDTLVKPGDIDRYEIYFSNETMGIVDNGRCKEPYNTVPEVGESVTLVTLPGGTTEFVTDLDQGKTDYFTMRVCAKGADDRCSDLSNEIVLDIPPSLLGEPTLTFKLN